MINKKKLSSLLLRFSEEKKHLYNFCMYIYVMYDWFFVYHKLISVVSYFVEVLSLYIFFGSDILGNIVYEDIKKKIISVSSKISGIPKYV